MDPDGSSKKKKKKKKKYSHQIRKCTWDPSHNEKKILICLGASVFLTISNFH